MVTCISFLDGPPDYIKNANTLDLTGKISFHRGKKKPVLITDVRQDYVKRLTGHSTVY